MKQDLIELYRIYLFALQERKEYGEQYGDTKELIEIYERKLIKAKVLKENEVKNNEK